MLRQNRVSMPAGKAFVTDDDNYVGDGTTMFSGYEIPFVGCVLMPIGMGTGTKRQG